MQNKTTIVGEIGINANGDVNLAKELITVAKDAGCDYVKFQKRTPDICVPEPQKNKMRETPWGHIRYIDYKHKIEFGRDDYLEIDRHCKEVGIKWFASVWDIPSVDFLADLVGIGKIPSALITDIDLVEYARERFDTLIISTGMSTQTEVDAAISAGNPDVVMHSVSSYPSAPEELNLEYIRFLKDHSNDIAIGYSGHEMELETTIAAVAIGATWVERHITLDSSMWGSDQSSSLGPEELRRLVRMIRNVEVAMGEYGPRMLMKSELAKRQSLRKN